MGEAPKTIRAALFDIDGTLIDSNDLHVCAWQDAFAEEGLVMPSDRIAGQIGKGGDNLVPALAPDLDEATQKRLGTREGDIFKQGYIGRAKPFPHARDLLARLCDAGVKVVFASSAAQEQLDHYLDLMEARDLVTATTSIDDVETSKPAPDIFAVALKKLDGLQPDQVLAVGDTPYDVASAGKSGIGTVAVLSGGFDREALADAVAIYTDVADLLDNFETSPLAR
ncbi:HAD family hydrolase [Sphingomonas sp.]|uniref:HAD family hydrolase n=1 Tax=Sphingomonas sp. TaxID=28214 RepID=UPI003B3A7413